MANNLSDPNFLEQLKALLTQWGMTDTADDLITKLIGGNAMGLSVFGFNNNQTLESNLRRQQTRLQMASMYGAIRNRMIAEGSTVAANNVYRMMGYTPAEIAAKNNEPGNPLQFLVSQFITRPQVLSAYGSMAGAFHSQRYMWDSALAKIPGSGRNFDELFVPASRQLMSDVIRESFAGKYAGLSVKETGTLAGELIRAGRFGSGLSHLRAADDIADERKRRQEEAARRTRETQAAQEGKSPRDPWDVSDAEIDNAGEKQRDKIAARVGAFKRELRSYAAAVNTLRDVINGPMEDVLAAFETLTGNKLVMMSANRVGSISSAVRSVLQNPGMSMAALQKITASQYGMIAPLGGDQATAAAMGLITAAGMSSQYAIEGVTDAEYAAAQGRRHRANYMNGVYRNAAAAYVHWLGNKQDNEDTRAAFMSAMTANGRDFNTGVSDYINREGVGYHIRNSALTNSIMRNPEFIAMANTSSMLPKYARQRDAIIKNALTGVAAEKHERIREILTSVVDPMRAQELLTTEGLMSATGAAQVTLNLQRAAINATGETNGPLATLMISRAVGAQQQLQASQAAGIWGKIVGERGGATGLEGIIQGFQRTGMVGGDALADVMYSAFGIDRGRIKSLAADLFLEDNDANRARRTAARSALTREIATSLGIDPNDPKSADQVNAVLNSLANSGSSGTAVLTALARPGARKEVVQKARRELIDLVSNGQPFTMRALEQRLKWKKDKEGKWVSDDKAEEALLLSEDTKARLVLESQLNAGVTNPNDRITATDEQVAEFQKAYKSESDRVARINSKRDKGKKLEAGTETTLATIRTQLKTRLAAYRAEHGEDPASMEAFLTADKGAGELLKKYKKALGDGEDANTAAQAMYNEMMNDRSVTDWLRQILIAIQSLPGAKQTGTAGGK